MSRLCCQLAIVLVATTFVVFGSASEVDLLDVEDVALATQLSGSGVGSWKLSDVGKYCTSNTNLRAQSLISMGASLAECKALVASKPLGCTGNHLGYNAGAGDCGCGTDACSARTSDAGWSIYEYVSSGSGIGSGSSSGSGIGSGSSSGSAIGSGSSSIGYTKLAGGKACGSGGYIETVEECEAAAASLGLSDLKVRKREEGGIDNAQAIYGCYVNGQNRLNFNKNDAKKNQDLSQGRMPLCRVISPTTGSSVSVGQEGFSPMHSADGKKCGPNHDPNRSHKLGSATVAECAASCQQNEECKYFTTGSSSGGWCIGCKVVPFTEHAGAKSFSIASPPSQAVLDDMLNIENNTNQTNVTNTTAPTESPTVNPTAGPTRYNSGPSYSRFKYLKFEQHFVDTKDKAVQTQLWSAANRCMRLENRRELRGLKESVQALRRGQLGKAVPQKYKVLEDQVFEAVENMIRVAQASDVFNGFDPVAGTKSISPPVVDLSRFADISPTGPSPARRLLAQSDFDNFHQSGTGACRDENGFYPAWGWFIGSETEVRRKCALESSCTGYFFHNKDEDGKRHYQVYCGQSTNNLCPTEGNGAMTVSAGDGGVATQNGQPCMVKGNQNEKSTGVSAPREGGLVEASGTNSGSKLKSKFVWHSGTTCKQVTDTQFRGTYVVPSHVTSAPSADSADHCSAMCDETPQCQFWIFNAQGNRKCQMKKNFRGHDSKIGAVSGFKCSPFCAGSTCHSKADATNGVLTSPRADYLQVGKNVFYDNSSKFTKIPQTRLLSGTMIQFPQNKVVTGTTTTVTACCPSEICVIFDHSDAGSWYTASTGKSALTMEGWTQDPDKVTVSGSACGTANGECEYMVYCKNVSSAVPTNPFYNQGSASVVGGAVSLPLTNTGKTRMGVIVRSVHSEAPTAAPSYPPSTAPSMSFVTPSPSISPAPTPAPTELHLSEKGANGCDYGVPVNQSFCFEAAQMSMPAIRKMTRTTPLTMIVSKQPGLPSGCSVYVREHPTYAPTVFPGHQLLEKMWQQRGNVETMERVDGPTTFNHSHCEAPVVAAHEPLRSICDTATGCKYLDSLRLPGGGPISIGQWHDATHSFAFGSIKNVMISNYTASTTSPLVPTDDATTWQFEGPFTAGSMLNASNVTAGSMAQLGNFTFTNDLDVRMQVTVGSSIGEQGAGLVMIGSDTTGALLGKLLVSGSLEFGSGSATMGTGAVASGPLLEADRKYFHTFQATGCPNRATADRDGYSYWKSRGPEGAFADMYSWCTLSQQGSATHKAYCCGTVDNGQCTPTKCTLQSRFTTEGDGLLMVADRTYDIHLSYTGGDSSHIGKIYINEEAPTKPACAGSNCPNYTSVAMMNGVKLWSDRVYKVSNVPDELKTDATLFVGPAQLDKFTSIDITFDSTCPTKLCAIVANHPAIDGGFSSSLPEQGFERLPNSMVLKDDVNFNFPQTLDLRLSVWCKQQVHGDGMTTVSLPKTKTSTTSVAVVFIKTDTMEPTTAPTFSPTPAPTAVPTSMPTQEPTTNQPGPEHEPYSVFFNPADYATNNGDYAPVCTQKILDTEQPTHKPTPSPTLSPTSSPTDSPTPSPTDSPTLAPTPSPTDAPTIGPTVHPTMFPTPTILSPEAVAERDAKHVKARADARARAQKEERFHKKLVAIREKKWEREREDLRVFNMTVQRKKEQVLAKMSQIIRLHKMCESEDSIINATLLRQELEEIRLPPSAEAAAVTKVALLKSIMKIVQKLGRLHELNRVHAMFSMKKMAFRLLKATSELRDHGHWTSIDPSALNSYTNSPTGAPTTIDDLLSTAELKPYKPDTDNELRVHV